MGKQYGRPAPRSIYPETIHSEQIRELAQNKDHLLIWYSLFHGVDDQGRMEARVSTIQTLCLGHLPEGAIKPRTIQEALIKMKSLQDADGVPLIFIYDANGTKVLQIAKWWEHQGYMRNSWPSRWDSMPGWVDEFRGHGKTAYRRQISQSRGTDGGTESATSGDALYPHTSSNNVPNGTSAHKPWDLFAAYLDELGIKPEDFPGPRIQLAHARRMLADGFTPDEVRAACKVFSQDDYWAGKGFDLATIRAHWGKLKQAQRAQPRKRAPRPITD